MALEKIQLAQTIFEGEVTTAYTDAHNHTNKTVLDNVSGINTGDETAATIETKLGVVSANITALSNLTGTNTGDQDLSELANISLSNINSTAQSALKTICSAFPTTSSGIGQVYTVVGTDNTSISAPSGGTWLILSALQTYISNAQAYRWNADYTNDSMIIAGGTQVIAARSGYAGHVRLWRIA